ncbi:hypothetical protein [Andreprevotia chitinilytica]|uniref:hypothetical protein n=1 Tax=Andreprevotia chitinilytica TaxID=396808 RepID=UPI000552627B|nr:hypothetical protein [Andreprevotia chitinilytica]
MNAIKKFALATCLIMFATGEKAQADEQSKLGKIDQMLDAMHLETAHRLGIETCIETASTAYYAPEEMVKKNGSYNGFTPKSAEWPKVEKLFKEYVKSTCTYMDYPALKALYVKFYMDNVTEEDMDAWLVFVQSQPGQAFLKNQDTIVKSLTSYSYQKSLEAGKAADMKLGTGLAALRTNDGGNDFTYLLMLGGKAFFAMTWLLMFSLLAFQQIKKRKSKPIGWAE